MEREFVAWKSAPSLPCPFLCGFHRVVSGVAGETIASKLFGLWMLNHVCHDGLSETAPFAFAVMSREKHSMGILDTLSCSLVCYNTCTEEQTGAIPG